MYSIKRERAKFDLSEGTKLNYYKLTLINQPSFNPQAQQNFIDFSSFPSRKQFHSEKLEKFFLSSAEEEEEGNFLL